MKDPEDEAFEQLALKQGQWEHTSGWRKRQIEQDFANIDDANNRKRNDILEEIATELEAEAKNFAQYIRGMKR